MADDKQKGDNIIEMDELRAGGTFEAVPLPTMPSPSSSSRNTPLVAILSYCFSSILMTVTNKYVLSGLDFNLNFFLLCVQVCWDQSRPSTTILTFPARALSAW